MEFKNILSLANNSEGCIVDCIFSDSKLGFEYINSNCVKRDYHIIKEFTTSPWQVAFDFANSVKNITKKKASLTKEHISTSKLDSLGKLAIVLVNPSFKDKVKEIYDRLSEGGIIICICEDSCNTFSSLSSLDKVNSFKKYSYIIKTKKVKSNSTIKRSQSVLT